MTTPQSERINIIESVQTPLAFFTLLVLVVEVVLGIVCGLDATSGPDRTFLIRSMVGILVLLIVVVAAIASFKPEALWGKRYSALEENLAELLARDVFEAFDGYLRNEPPTRKAAYRYFSAVTGDADYVKAAETKGFAKKFVSTVHRLAGLRDFREPDVEGVLNDGEEQA